MTILNIIGNERIPAVSGATLPVYDPATGEVYGECPRGVAADVDAAVRAGLAALDGPWGRLTHAQRADALVDIAARVEQSSHELVDVEVTDTGKPRWQVERMDRHALATNLREAAHLVAAISDDARPGPGALGITTRVPFGLVGLLLPWNFPALIFAEKVAHIIAAGNAVVVKPSEATPASAARSAELLLDAGLPAGVVNVVHGLGSEAGAAIVAHASVPRISFTGRTSTGRSVAAAAARALKTVSLELSGKNPFVVSDSADIGAAAEAAAFSSFLNSGQVCTSGSRIEVHESVRDEFVDAFLVAVRSLRPGLPDDPGAHLGPIIERGHYERLSAMVDSASVGATPLHIGTVPDGLRGWYLPPVVTEPDTMDHPLLHEEVFGPVATITTYRDLAQVIESTRRSPYGLAAFLWTSRLAEVGAYLDGADAGRVWVNTAHSIPAGMTLPPWKASGLGVEGGPEGLLSFMRVKTANVSWAPAPVKFSTPPH